MADDSEIVDYEDEVNEQELMATKELAPEAAEVKKGSYAGIHCSGFRDFLLRPELLNAITDCGFEHPSQVQQKCIPQAVLGGDVICQAKSGMGKTAVFVLAILQQLQQPVDGRVSVLVIAHCRELAFQICHEFQRFSKYLPGIKTSVVFGGVPVTRHRQLFKDNVPHIVVGCPGRLRQLIDEHVIDCSHIKHFIVDECDKVFAKLDMRSCVQDIFRACPGDKQVMMFSATLPEEVRPVCMKFMRNPMRVFVDDDKLTLDGLQQYYLRLMENEKNRKLCELLDLLEFNQVIIFVNSKPRCEELNQLLLECNFPSICIHGNIPQEERLARYQSFKSFQQRILVATELFGRGMDIERVNIVFNYDMPLSSDDYLHRVGRAGRFGTKGLTVTFVSSKDDAERLTEVQERFEVSIPELPEQIDIDSYMNN